MFAALCVIIIHVDFVSLPRLLIAAKILCYWALTFFFVTSGYFIAEKWARTGSLDMQPLIERMGWVFVFWALIYLPLKIETENLDWRGVFDTLTTPIFFYNGDSYHLWYISATAVACLFIAACYRYRAQPLLIAASIAAVGMLALASGYQFIAVDFTQTTVISLARFWRAVPLIYLGFLVYQKGIPSWRVSVFFIIFGLLMLPAEIKFISWYYGHSAYQELLLGSIPIGFGVACLGLNNLKIFQRPLLAKLGREYSLGIYLIHPLMIYLSRYLPYQYMPFLPRGAVWEALFPFVILFLCLAALSTFKRLTPAFYNLALGIRAAQ